MARSTKGNGQKGEDPEAFADKYMKDYKEHIFHQAEISMEDIRGEDVEEAIRSQKETAGGMG